MSRITIAIACLVSLLACESAQAQRRVPGYSNRPTISPYVNLFQSNNGGLNSYFSFVRPQLQLDQQIRQQNMQFETNRQSIQRESVLLQRSIQDATNAAVLSQRPTSAAAGFRRPAGGFMNFGTFYPAGQPTTGVRRSR